jgi:hypothetical protein
MTTNNHENLWRLLAANMRSQESCEIDSQVCLWISAIKSVLADWWFDIFKFPTFSGSTSSVDIFALIYISHPQALWIHGHCLRRYILKPPN